ncbi:hypothetical protein AADZ90_001150 [Aestuariibius sp. 2305UL40-4]|uniref:hypothetical protein n=1 Tax=Aestuariibius violaceus TaxID=3234132 RepID=UPI00345E951A
MKVLVALASAAIVIGGGSMAETRAGDAFRECTLTSDVDGSVIELARPASELAAIGVAAPDSGGTDVELVVDDGMRVSVKKSGRIFRITATTADWVMFNGIRVGLSREDTLSIIPLEYDPEAREGKTLAFANPSFRGNLLDMCMNEITFDSADRVEVIEITWTPMSISPARPPRVPLPMLDQD